MADVSKATQMNNGLAIQVYNEQSCLLMEKRMRTAYQSAIDELQKELDDFYEKYATNNKIDLQVAKQKLSLSDSENVKDLAEQYKQLLSKKNIGVRTQKKLDEIAAKTKVSRLEQLLVNCTKQAAEVGMKAKDEMIDVGSLMYKDGFGHTMFNIQKTVGMGVNFNMPSARVIKTASNVEWLGATFTDRTGYTLDRLTNNIEQIIPQLFIQGKNADEFGKAIAKQFNMSENAAKRDMRTLTTLITNQASILAYNNCEMVEEFEFVATLDGRTSDKCRSMDGKRFKLNEAAPFVNQPPLHYNCRSTTIPYFEDLDEYNPSERVARDEQGKTYMVPANMSYREWCTKHAQGLYANSDKTDWNYEPEKVLAYERIVDERRKLKALQEDRVVYQDSDFVVDHDINNYSKEEIEHLMQLFNVHGNAGTNLLQEAKQKLQQKINETMTKINNIRKELNSDKTANILPAKDYNDIIGNLHKYYEMLNDEHDILNEKSNYQKYVKVMGLNDKPETMSKQDLQAYIADNKDLPVLYRAVTDVGSTGMVGGVTRGKYLRCGILNDLMYGSQQYIGDGIYGDGLYFSTQPTHKSYGNFSGSKETAIDRKYMIQATFKSGTKKILWDDLQKLMSEYRDKGYNILDSDPSSFARSLGYHVIQAHKDGESEIYYNIIDRSCLVVQDVDKESAELSPEEQKRRIGDSIKQKNPINDDQIILNMKRSVVNRNSAYDIQNFVTDKTILDDDVFGNLEILINFEKYSKDILDIDIYEDAFNKAYDDLYDKMNSLLDTDVPHDFVIFKRDDGTEVRTELIFSDLEDWLYDMEQNRNGSVEDKSFALEKIKFALRNDYFEHIINRTINDDGVEDTDLNDIDAAVKNYIDKFTKQTQNIVEDEFKRKQGGDKVDIKEIEKENKEVLNSIYEMYASPAGMANEIRYNKTFTFKKRDDNRDRFLIDLYTKQTLANDKIFKKILALDETKVAFSMNSEMRSGDVVYDIDEYYSEVYEEIVKMLEDRAEQSGTFDVEINVLNKKKMLPIAIDKTLKTFKDNNTDIQSKRDTVQKFIGKMQQVVDDEYYSEIEKNYDNLKIDNAFEISKNNLDIVRNEMQTFLNYRLRNVQQQVIDTIHTLTSEEIKALERKDTYDFKELQRKALKEFKYYKGTMKKAEIQNESLRKDERISKNNEKYFQQTMRDIFEKNDFCMRLNKNVLPLIAESKFMNQFETGNAPLGLTFDQRRAVAKKMFTIPEDAEGSEYEKYGFLGSKNPKDDFKDDENFTGDYGDSIVRFKKRNLMYRTTFTIGDSLFNCINDDVRSSPVINPQIASIQRGHVNEVIYGLNVVENADAEKSYLDIQALTRQKYVELQYHGNLIIDDVESVTFNKKTTNINSPEVRRIIAMLKERGIKCYLVDSKREVIQEI